MGSKKRSAQVSSKKSKKSKDKVVEEVELQSEEEITEEMIEEIKEKLKATLTDEDYEDDNEDDTEEEEVSSDQDGSINEVEEVGDYDHDEEEVDGDEDEMEEIEMSEDDDEEQGEEESNAASSDEEIETLATLPIQPSDGKYRNKQRCLLIASRGVTSRYRHFLEDLRTLIPHHKKDSKLDIKHGDNGGVGRAVNEICDIKGCNTVLFLECRKRGQDAYLWMGYTAIGAATNPAITSTGGPSVKFHLSNVHTMDELRMTGNCMRGSRPILTFDASFDQEDHLKLLKLMFIDVFGTPRGHPKSKPFVDRVMGFYYADGKIWVRNFQISEEEASNAKEAAEKKQGGLNTQLVEIGPRFVLDPIRIFNGPFSGQTLYVNPNFISPNTIRAQTMQDKGNLYQQRKKAQKDRKQRKDNIVLPEDPLASVFR